MSTSNKSYPHAGHFDFRRACLRPQKRHSISSLELTRLSRYDFMTFVANLMLCRLMSSHFKDSSLASVASAAFRDFIPKTVFEHCQLVAFFHRIQV